MKRTAIKLMIAVLGVLLSINANSKELYVSVSGLQYIIDTNRKTAIVIGSITSGHSPELIIPNTITYEGNVYKVTSIRQRAFIESSVFDDPEYGEYDTRITSVIIGDNVEDIGENAFYGCKSLKSVTIGRKVKNIDRGAFDLFEGAYWGHGINVNIKDLAAWCNIVFGDDKANPLYGVSTLECHKKNPSRLFLNGQEIVDLVIPKGITSLRARAFIHCSSIKTLSVPEGVKFINSAFKGCINLTSVSLPNSLISMSGFQDCISI